MQHGRQHKMPELHDSYPFGGVDAESDNQPLDEQFRRLVRQLSDGQRPTYTFSEMLGSLQNNYNAVTVPAGYRDPSGEWIEVGRHAAVVNPKYLADARSESPRTSHIPDRDGQGAEVEQRDALWELFTDSYTPQTPQGLYSPLADALQEKDATDAFGHCRLYRDGGSLHMDVFVPEYSIEFGSDELVLGLSTGHDHFGSRALTAEVVAYDAASSGDEPTIYRQLSDTYSRKHTKNAKGDTESMWESTIERLGKATEQITATVADAMKYEIALDQYPFDTEQFYANLGLPSRRGRVAPLAAQKVDDGEPVSAFRLYRVGTWALSQDMDATNTAAFRDHTGTLNTLLFDPPTAERQVLETERRRLKEKAAEERNADGDQTTLDSGVSIESLQATVADIDDTLVSVYDAVEVYDSQKEKLRSVLDAESGEEAEA